MFRAYPAGRISPDAVILFSFLFSIPVPFLNQNISSRLLLFPVTKGSTFDPLIHESVHPCWATGTRNIVPAVNEREMWEVREEMPPSQLSK
jgi:hypothetical protein